MSSPLQRLEKVSTRTTSLRIPDWQAEWLIEEFGGLHAGLRACVEQMISENRPLMDGAPNMLRLLATKIERENLKS